MGRVAGQAAARGVLMVERQQRVAFVGHRLEEGVAEERLVERQPVEQPAETLPLAVHPLDKGLQQR